MNGYMYNMIKKMKEERKKMLIAVGSTMSNQSFFLVTHAHITPGDESLGCVVCAIHLPLSRSPCIRLVCKGGEGGDY
jgi:hypothetical protein